MSNRPSRRAFLAAAVAVPLAGCSGPGSTGDGPAGEGPAMEGAEPVARSGTETDSGQSATPTVPAAWPPTVDQALPLPRAPAELESAAISGGPPKDGIPAIDDPSFLAPDAAAEFLAPGDPVFAVAMGAERKAYPQRILAGHEIVNDVIDDTPVSVTYCPLTGTAMGFERGETTFGVSGRLVNNNLIMYDRATETWWPQILATSIPGLWKESVPSRSLVEFPVRWTTYGAWRAANPDGQILSRDTNLARSYEIDPYGSYNPRGGYYARDAAPMFEPFVQVERLPPKAIVLGTRTAAGATAFEQRALREAGLLRGRIGETSLVAVWDPTLETGYVYRNPNGRTIAVSDGTIRVDGTGHPPDDLPLPVQHAVDAFWFAWRGFYPETELND